MINAVRIHATIFTLSPFMEGISPREQILLAHIAIANGVDFAVRLIAEMDGVA